MERLLMVSSSEKGQEFLSELAKNSFSSQLVQAKNGSEARRLLLNAEFDIVVIDAPLIDEPGWTLAMQVAPSVHGVVLMAKAEFADEITRRVEKQGVFVLPKPVGRALLFQTLRLAALSGRRMAQLKEENRRLQRQLQEQRLTARAKCLLIQYEQMTEDQAHHAIEKQAMDLRISKCEVAEEIIRRYETD